MNTHDHTPHTLTDDELDTVLAAARSELFREAVRNIDLARSLLALMADDDPPEHPNITIDPATIIDVRARARDCPLDPDHVLAIARELGRASANALARALDPHPDLDRARPLAHDTETSHTGTSHVDDLALTSSLDRDLAQTRERKLALARALDRDLAIPRATAFALARTLTHDRDLTRAHNLARDLIQALHALPVDASGTDLSHLQDRHLDALADVIWTSETIWPPHLQEQIAAHSESIRPGTYRVRRCAQPNLIDID